MLSLTPIFYWLLVIGFSCFIAGTTVVLWYMYRLYKHREDVRYFPWVFASVGFYVGVPVFTNVATVISLFQPIIEVETGLLFLRGVITAVTAYFLYLIYPRLLQIPSAKELEEEYSLFKARENISLEGQITTTNGRMTAANNKACIIYGYSREELLSLDVEQLIHPEDLEKVLTYRLENRNDKYECRGIHSTGKILYLEVRGQDLLYKGQKVRITAIKDLTREREIQTKLQEDAINNINQLETRDNRAATAEKQANLLDRLRTNTDGI